MDRYVEIIKQCKIDIEKLHPYAKSALENYVTGKSWYLEFFDHFSRFIHHFTIVQSKNFEYVSCIKDMIGY